MVCGDFVFGRPFAEFMSNKTQSQVHISKVKQPFSFGRECGRPASLGVGRIYVLKSRPAHALHEKPSGTNGPVEMMLRTSVAGVGAHKLGSLEARSLI